MKGVRYNAEGDSWSAFVYRRGRYYLVGAYYSQEQAVQAYERELKNENPDLHAAPQKVERPADPVLIQRGDPDATSMPQA